MEMENIRCYECNKSTVLREDYSEGDLTCTECGLVLNSHLVDFRQEWRTSDVDLSSASCARAEKPPNNAFFKDAELFTTISKPKAVMGEFGSNTNSNITDLERKYGVLRCRSDVGLHVICTMADKLELLKCITDHAMEIYTMLKESKALHRVNHNVAASSCLYVACQLEKYARTFKEIIAVADVCVEIRTIARTSRRIKQELQNMNYNLDMGEKSAADCVRRFCSRLQMQNQMDVKATFETVVNLEKKWDIRGNPTTIVAATIFMITQLSSDKRNLAEIAKATGVSEKTISASYKEISPFAKEMAPQWFLNQLVSQN